MTRPAPAPIVHRHPAAKRRALRAIALFEAAKGLAALIATVGLLNLMHRDVRQLAIELIGRFGLHPEGHYPSILLHYAGLLPGANVHLIVLAAVGYIAVRLAEAYGLWCDRAWAEWLGALSGGLYVPFELHHLLYRPSLTTAAVLAGNLLVVAVLGHQLWLRRRH